MSLYVGIDLHSSNNFIGIIDKNDNRLFQKRLPNQLDEILKALAPFRSSIEGIVVESTYNWYWLADGLQENGYTVHLANPAAVKQYEGLKHSDDRRDSFWLAHLLRLNILPEGYIYPKEDRPIRDLMRRRLLFVKQRTAHILSIQSMITRNPGIRKSGNDIKKMTEAEAEELFDQEHLVTAAVSSISTIRFLTERIRAIEKEVKSKIKIRDGFRNLLTVPGIGDILALTIMPEVGSISRFPNVGNYSSYCRCVRSVRISNGKNKGKGNAKSGNKYLAWAYVEAANFAVRFCPYAHRFFQRKTAKANRALAVKALSNKLARASYYMMKDGRPYSAEMLFG
jgi:transposase